MVYDEILGNAVTYRRRPNGVEVAGSDGTLTKLDEDTYVSRLVRAVRNSSHGLLDVLREHEDRYLLATNTGDIPAELPALVAFIGIALIADAEGLIDGTTRQRLTGNEPA